MLVNFFYGERHFPYAADETQGDADILRPFARAMLRWVTGTLECGAPSARFHDFVRINIDSNRLFPTAGM